MKLDYRRDIHQRVMIISPDEGAGEVSYRARMISENDIPGFVKCSFEYMNGAVRMYYDISGLTPLSVVFNDQKADAAFYRRIINALLTVFNTVNDYLLDADDLLLSKETVFVDSGSGEIRFVCFPFEKRNTDNALKDLAAFLLSRTAEDAETIKTACRLYSACSEEYISAEGFMEVLRQIKEPEIPEARETPPPVRESFFDPSSEPLYKNDEEKDETGGVQGKIRKIAGFFSGLAKRRRDSEDESGSGGWQEYRMPEKGCDRNVPEPAFVPERKKPEPACGAGKDTDSGETALLSKYRDSGGGDKTPAWLVPADIFFGDTIELMGDSYVAGRGRSADGIYIPRKQVSRKHARLVRRRETYELTDLGSKNGTFVNGTRLVSGERWLLSDGDVLKFADMEYHFCLTDNQ